jgi:rhodanese-related sulfurtransferase
MKHISNGVLFFLLVVMGSYFLYSKGYIFANFAKVDVKEAYKVLQNDASNSLFIDVRTPEEHDKDGRIDTSILIPLSSLEKKLSTLESYRDKDIYLYCRSGSRSVSAARILAEHGFKVFNVNGGMKAWKAQGLPTY